MAYDPVLFVVSFFVAMMLSTTAIKINFITHHHPKLRMYTALIMSLAISGMHYTGMASVSYFAIEGEMLITQEIEPLLLIGSVSISAIFYHVVASIHC